MPPIIDDDTLIVPGSGRAGLVSLTTAVTSGSAVWIFATMRQHSAVPSL